MLNFKKCIEEYRAEFDAKEIPAYDMIYLSMGAFTCCALEALDSTLIKGEESIEKEINECLDVLLKDVYTKNENETWISFFENSIDNDTKQEYQASYYKPITVWRTGKNGGKYQKDLIDVTTSTNKYYITALGLAKILNSIS